MTKQSKKKEYWTRIGRIFTNYLFLGKIGFVHDKKGCDTIVMRWENGLGGSLFFQTAIGHTGITRYARLLVLTQFPKKLKIK